MAIFVSDNPALRFLRSTILKVKVDWKGCRTITDGRSEMSLEALAKRVNRAYMFIMAGFATDKEPSEFDLVNRKKIFNDFKRVIDLYESIDSSRYLIGRVVYDTARIFADWNLHTNLKRCEKNLEVLGTFSEQFRGDLLPPGYREAKTVYIGSEKFFVVPKEDFASIVNRRIELISTRHKLQFLEGEINSLKEQLKSRPVSRFTHT